MSTPQPPADRSPARLSDPVPVSDPLPCIARVAVPLTTVWTDPTAPRDVDAAMVRTRPDAREWLRLLDSYDEGEDGRGRLGLHGRVETQLSEHEPVVVVALDPSGDWARVSAPWQPSPGHAMGYPGWVPAAHLGSSAPMGEVPRVRADHPADDVADAVIGWARGHVGLRYLWGGTTPLGLDCSGLVHAAWRRLGIVVPRDAWAQAEVAEPVDLHRVEPGDLYFFAHPGRRIHHVGIVTAPGRMVHASETGGWLVEEDLPPARLETLVAAGRLPSAPAGLPQPDPAP